MPKLDIAGFIAHWSAASASERANSQAFLLDLCDLLEVPRPDPHPDAGYFFEYPVTEQHADGTTSQGRIDLYKRLCFLLESKQFQEARAEASQLELAAEAAGVITRKKSSQPVRGTNQWDDAMIKARGQAERYVRALPADEPNPPLIIVVDVGHTFELFADFSQAGKAYLPFPDPRTFRIRLADLADAKIRERLRLAWTNPAALDPARQSADVTREVSAHLAELAKSLEQAGHEPEVVAQFLTRCLFCMFAEDVGLLPEHAFTELLASLPADGTGFEEVMQQLFREMNAGTGQGISVILRKKLLHFNGGLFANDTVLPVNGLQLGLLKEAAKQNWGHVEPAIFGTLLERALNADERHQLGAHFTPRAYVERLVLPTLVEPLRAEWETVRAAAITHARAGDLKQARAAVNAFHDRLCNLKVLDPACGTGNFLYVSLQQLKILEGEVLDVAAQFGENFKLELETHTIDPHQFLGLEINPRAASIAELVLWIGYLQWHFRLHGKRTPPEPILRAFKNIQCRDAVLAYDGEPQPVTWEMALANPDLPGLPDEVREQLRTERGDFGLRRQAKRDAALGEESPADANAKAPPPLRSAGAVQNDLITVWNRRSMKKDLVTGRDVPDETRRVPLLAYANPRPALWPAADFIVGNPPFIGTARMREDLGDGYAETLRAAYPDVPESADFVLYWWHKAATLVRSGEAKRFGLITTNSLRQTFARRVVQLHLVGRVAPRAPSGDLEKANTSPRSGGAHGVTRPTDQPLSLLFAIPDHPWVDTAEGAAARIAMTVGAAGEHPGELLEVTGEEPQDDGSEKVSFQSKRGKISADLTTGADVSSAVVLTANDGLACPGVKLHGAGFIVTPEESKELGLGKISGLEKHIRHYRNGKDLNDAPRGVMVIDLFGLAADEVRERFPAVYQHVLNRVKPERDTNNRATYRDNWWVFGEPRRDFRPALIGLPRYIATTETSKHRFFQFLDAEILPDNMVIAIALDDAFHLGVLSSRIHVVFSLTAGGRLGVGNDPRYNKSRCFDPFPFPLCGEAAKERIRKLAEELDAHRKRVQAQHGLTLTGLYNVLEKLRAAGVRPSPAAATSEPATASETSDASRSSRIAAPGDGRTPSVSLTAKEKEIHDQGLVSVLKQLHDDLDAAVFAAYGWPATLTDAEILERLVALNAERAAEEKRGVIHWLRPEYQLGKQKAEIGKQNEMNLPEGKTKPTARKTPRSALRTPKLNWPKPLVERVQAVEAALHAASGPVTPADLANQFTRAKPEDVAEILETLVTLGRATGKGSSSRDEAVGPELSSMANPKHLQILKSGVSEWNIWRKENASERPTLHGAALASSDLRNANLASADLRSADLGGADFRRADLTRADLTRADLTRANLCGANLSGAALGGAKLRRADLTRADLIGTEISDANLTEADLGGANLIVANLGGANLGGADLRGADLRGAILHETAFANTNLSGAKGLDACAHHGPSTIDLRTMQKSGRLPESFLRGCGLPDDFITYLPSFLDQPIQFYSCFISYSHEDQAFARLLHDRLQGQGIRCWLDEHQLLPGDDLHDRIDQGIRLWDKVLLCASQASLTSWWVDGEINRAFQKEALVMKERGKKVHALIPLNLDGFLFSADYQSGKKAEITSRVAANFVGWEHDPALFDRELQKVVRALKTDDAGREKPPAPKL